MIQEITFLGSVQIWVVVSALYADSFEPQARRYSKLGHCPFLQCAVMVRRTVCNLLNGRLDGSAASAFGERELNRPMPAGAEIDNSGLGFDKIGESFFYHFPQDNPMPEMLEPVEWERKTPSAITPHVPRGRRHKRKRRLSARQKQVRFFTVLYAIILFALFLGLLWWLNQPHW